MNEQLSVLKVRMFGRTAITYDGSPIPFSAQGITKVQKLLLIILYGGSEGISRNELIEKLYGREEVLDISNNLRVTLHRLRKLIKEAGLPEHEYIVVKNGIYCCSCPMELKIDALEFKALLQKAEETDDHAEKSRILKRACELYKGEFLEDLANEEWVLVENTRYKKFYEDSLIWLCEYLYDRAEYAEILKLCSVACEIYPFDEWQAVKIDCYIAMKQYENAFREYKDTEKLFLEELGVSPSNRMIKQLKSLGNILNNKPQIIAEVREMLKEKNASEGAYYCAFPSFQDEYRFACRIAERTGQTMYLMLCTITNGKGYPQENGEILNVMMQNLQEALKKCLRRCDTFTRYSPSQFLALLVGTNGENCKGIFHRISEYFCQEHKAWKNYLCGDAFSTSDLQEELSDLGGGGRKKLTIGWTENSEL